MKPLLLSVPGKMLEKKLGALLHFVAAYIENLRTNAARAMVVFLDVHQFCVAIAGVVIVAAERRKFESFIDQVPNPGEHFHAAKFHFRNGKSTPQRTAGNIHP